jgi:uncharacterized protein YjbI with pentapeptide repeats
MRNSDERFAVAGRGDTYVEGMAMDGWGEPISAERARELEEHWRRGGSGSSGPFAGQTLKGADVYWLAIRTLAGAGGDMAAAERRLRDAADNPLLQVSLDFSALDLCQAVLSHAQLQGAILGHVRLQGATLAVADLTQAHLSGANLDGAFLDRACLEQCALDEACLDRASLWAANLHQASLYRATLNDAILHLADLRDADLRSAVLARADLSEAYLQTANFTAADLHAANLYEASLEGTVLSEAQLQQSDLRRTTLSSTSRLNGAHLDEAAVEQMTLEGTNLAVVEWSELKRLGDEISARQRRKRLLHYDHAGQRELKDDGRKRPQERKADYLAAGRAYRSLSVALRDQGLSRAATRFQFRGEVMSRRATYHDFKAHLQSRAFFLAPYYFFAWLLSLMLGAFAGYGVHHVWRLALTYLVIVGGFAGLYWAVGQQAHAGISTLDAFVLSLTSFHGRGLQPSAGLTDPMRALAGAEAVLGLLIEALFIAAFTRRITGS